MSIYYILGILSAVIFSLGYLPYIFSIIHKKTKPHPFSWFLWAIIGSVTFYFYIQVGAHETLPFAFLNFFMPLIVVLLSLKYWKGSFSRFDYICLGFSCIAIVAYILFHLAVLSLTLSICADFIAFLPTIRKTYVDPSSENLLSWSIFLSGYALSIAAISKWSYGVAVFPIYLTTFGFIMCVLILRGRLKKAR